MRQSRVVGMPVARFISRPVVWESAFEESESDGSAILVGLRENGLEEGLGRKARSR